MYLIFCDQKQLDMYKNVSTDLVFLRVSQMFRPFKHSKNVFRYLGLLLETLKITLVQLQIKLSRTKICTGSLV